MKHTISWFEIPVNDMERACKFYSEILGIKIEAVDFNGYNIAPFPAEKDTVNGALIQGDQYKPSTEGTIIYLNTGEDLNLVLMKVEPAGGKIIEEKTEIVPDKVYAAQFEDSEGNRVGLFSTN